MLSTTHFPSTVAPSPCRPLPRPAVVGSPLHWHRPGATDQCQQKSHTCKFSDHHQASPRGRSRSSRRHPPPPDCSGSGCPGSKDGSHVRCGPSRRGIKNLARGTFRLYYPNPVHRRGIRLRFRRNPITRNPCSGFRLPVGRSPVRSPSTSHDPSSDSSWSGSSSGGTGHCGNAVRRWTHRVPVPFR